MNGAAIDVRGVGELKKFFASAAGQLDFAVALAQTRLARTVWTAEKDQMRKDIDRPTPWSLGALQYEKAVKGGKAARVWFKDPFGYQSGLGSEDYLGVQITGGVRTRERRSEKRLRLFGLLPAGYTWIPAKGVKLDRYGNVPGALLTKILSNLGTIDTARNTGTAATTKYVVGTWGAMKAPGIFQSLRNGKDLKPVLWFIKAPTYKPRYKFYERADKEVAANVAREMREAVDYALRTAR